MGTYGRVTIGALGQPMVTEETTFGTTMEQIFPPENKLDKALRLMGVDDGKRTFKSTDFKRSTSPFRPSDKFPRAVLEEQEFDVGKMRRKFSQHVKAKMI